MTKFDTYRIRGAASISGTNTKRRIKKQNNRKARRMNKKVDGETLIVHKTLGQET